jgi:hypothetical protein
MDSDGDDDAEGVSETAGEFVAPVEDSLADGLELGATEELLELLLQAASSKTGAKMATVRRNVRAIRPPQVRRCWSDIAGLGR